MMGRRRLVALVSALLMLLIGAGVIAAFVVATQSERGREVLRRLAEAQLRRSIEGRLHLGTLSGSFLTDLRVDSIELRDPQDSLFLATGPVRLTFDPRDLLDGRFFIRTVEIERPRLVMRRGEDDRWTKDLIWPRDDRPRLPRPRTRFGTMVVLEQVRIVDGAFALQMPWGPADSLRGAARDSAIAVQLADARRETRRAGRDRFVRTWRWTAIGADLPRVRLAHPDSAGRHFTIARLDATESDPPFEFRGIAGALHWVGDTVRFDFPRFTLPGSVGRAEGRLTWGNGNPLTPRVRVFGDSVALADIAWISPSLPTTGGGSMVLDISRSRAVPDAYEYAISGMDARSHASRIRGRMTWVVGGPVTILRDVDLEGAPVDFALLERFNEGPFPYPFRGRISGRVRARGGPLHRWVVDDATLTFRDANVPGAVTAGRGRGMLDILRPARTVFRGFDLELAGADLRTPQFLNPEFPRVDGIVAGRARLDSLWLDVRIEDADLTHRNDDLPVTRLRGRGRLDGRGEEMAYELAAVATPLSFTALARSYPLLRLRGEYSGTVRARGTLSDLAFGGDLVGPAGRIEGDLRVDGVAPVYRAAGRVNLTAFDPAEGTDLRRAPHGELTGRAMLDVAFDSLADLRGVATVALDRSALDGTRVFAGEARLAFRDGRLLLDTLHLETSAFEMHGAGGLGLHAGVDDTLRIRSSVDSLGGLRRWLASVERDTLAGRAVVDARFTGSVRDLGARASLDATGLLVEGLRANRVRAEGAFTGLGREARGALRLTLDTARAGGLGIARAIADVWLDGARTGRVVVQAAGSAGTFARVGGRVTRDDSAFVTRVDSLALTTALQRWLLAAPATFSQGTAGFAVDSFVLRGRPGASLRLAGRVPATDTADLALAARGVPVADLAELLQLRDVEAGEVDLDLRLGGTRAAPDLLVEGTLREALVRGLRADLLRARATATADELRVSVALGPAAAPRLVAEGTLPVRLGLDADGPRVEPERAVSGRVRGDSVGLRILERYAARGNGDPGFLSARLDVSGTWRHPLLHGSLLVRSGNLRIAPLGDVRWREVEADVGFFGDSIAIRRATATTANAGRNGRAQLDGWFRIADRENPAFDLRLLAREFHAFNQRDVADMDVSDSLQLNGTLRGATLRGALTVDRGVIAIPELASKDVIALEEFDRFGLMDTTSLLEQRQERRRPWLLEDNLTVRNVPVRIGRDVWLRSEEANINLGGAVSITVSQPERTRDEARSQLALTGTLETVRGTYRLNLGPVQRTFAVETGEIRFFGDTDLDPALDITALHTVRQYSQQGARPDVRVRAHLGGTLRAPSLELSSPDSLRVTNADLISYLVTGGPSFAIGDRDADYTSTAARVVLSSLGSVLGGKAAGGLCDDAQLSTAGLEGYRGRIQQVGGSILAGTRFNCAKQLSDKTFVRLDAGLCQVGQLVAGGSGDVASFADNIGVKLDYLLRPGLTASVGVEPPTNAILCAQNAGASARGFAPTPRQFGLDLFRVWRF